MPRYQPGDRTRTINFRIPIELFERLELAAAADDRSFNSMAVRLLGEALETRVEKNRRRRPKAVA